MLQGSSCDPDLAKQPPSPKLFRDRRIVQLEPKKCSQASCWSAGAGVVVEIIYLFWKIMKTRSILHSRSLKSLGYTCAPSCLIYMVLVTEAKESRMLVQYSDN